MTVNGKRDRFTKDDLHACGKAANIKAGRCDSILHEVVTAVERWPEFAAEAGVDERQAKAIRETLRLEIPRT